MSTATLPGLRVLADDELGEIVSGGDDGLRTAAVAELDRRDAHARAQARRHSARRVADSAWAEAAHAQYLRASEACRGHLLSEHGKRAGMDEWSLWSGPQHVADASASGELRAFWASDGGRLTVTAWRDGLAADRRDERETNGKEQAMGLIRDGVRVAEMASRAANRNTGQSQVRQDYEAAREATRQRQAQELTRPQAQEAAVAISGMGTVAARRERPRLDGQAVLGYVRAWLANYARWPSEAALDVAALWAAHACARDKDGVLIWGASPRLMFLSSDPGSGKSVALELESLLCQSRYGPLAEPTQAVVAHMLGSMHEPVFLDESDVLFGSGKRKEGLRAILNLGYKRKGTVPHMKGGKIVDLPAFGAVALAGLDVVANSTAGNLDALLSRCVIVRMCKSGERVPQIGERARREGALLHLAMAAWCQQERPALEAAGPQLPDWLTGRPAEIWAPLLAVADAAGGDWPERARMAAEDLALAPEAGDTADLMDGLQAMAAGWPS